MNSELMRRRKALEGVLCPADSRGPWERAVRLAIIHGVVVVASDKALAWQKTRTIGTPPIASDEALAEFAHELGHILDPWPERSKLQREFFAWVKGMDLLGPWWTAAMSAQVQRCLSTYSEFLSPTEHRRRPEDHATWGAMNALVGFRARTAGTVFMNDRARARAEREALGEYAGALDALVGRTGAAR